MAGEMVRAGDRLPREGRVSRGRRAARAARGAGLRGEIVSFIGAYPFAEMNQIILAYHVRAHGEIVIGDEIVGVKAVPPDKLRPWPRGTGHAGGSWCAPRAGAGPRGAGGRQVCVRCR